MKLTPEEIVKKGLVFKIPIYQRLFEWTPENVHVLLDDLKLCYEKDLKKDYFIGMLTSTKNNELVDGQQRFVVMMLIASVLKTFHPSDGVQSSKNDKKNVWESFLLTDLTNPKPRLSFTSRPSDNEYLHRLIDDYMTVLKSEDDPADNINMKNAVREISEYFNEIEDKEGFSDYIFSHLSFFISQLPDKYSPADLNVYFERMNTTGKNLEQHEILKVKMLQHLDNNDVYMQLWNKLSDVDTVLIRKYEKETEEQLRDRKKKSVQLSMKDIIDQNIINGMNKNNQNNGGAPTIKEITASEKKPNSANYEGTSSRGPLAFEQLLLNVLYYYIKTKMVSYDDKRKIPKINLEEFFRTSNLLETFLKYLPYEGIDKNNDKEKIKIAEISEFLEILLRARIALDVCFVRPMENGYSLDMASTDETNDGAKKTLLMYESMLYVSSSNATNYRWFGWIMDKIKDGIPSIEDLLKELKIKDNDEHPMPDPDKLSYDNIDRYWFWRLDYYLWEKREEYFKANALALKVANNYIFRRNRSIEHIAPQTPEQDATLKLEKTDRDKFGNLAMISAGLNSTLQNKTYNVKFGHVKDYCNGAKSGSIESLKMLWDYTNTENETWNLDEINKHQEKMLQILKESY